MPLKVPLSRFALSALLCAALVPACATSRNGARTEPSGDPVAGVPAQELFDAGVILARAGDHIRAEQYLVAAMHRGIPEARALPLILEVCVRSSRLRAAVSYASPYLENHPEDWRLRYLVGTILAGLGENAAARHHLEAVLAANDANANVHYAMATLLRDSYNDPRAADGHFRRYLELEPAGPHAEEARAGLLRQVPQ